MPTKQLSIVIPVCNKYNFTSACLNDLYHLDNSIHNIIIVDNGSTDETELGIKELQKKIKNLFYIRMNENVGFGKACNEGFRMAETPFVMFLNNDIRVSSHVLSWTDVYIDALGVNSNQIISPTGGYVDPKKEFAFSYETQGDKKFNYLSGWMLASSKECFNKLIENDNVGPFRGDLFFAFFEDTFLSFRAKELGIELKLLTNNSVHHFGHITAKSLNINKMYNTSKSTFANYWKKDK